MDYSPDFVARVLAHFDRWDAHDNLYWRTGRKYGGGEYPRPAAFFVNVNDVFRWACSDLEEVTPANVHALEQAYADAEAAVKLGHVYGAELFAARVRGERPQHAAYPKPEYAALWPLFDACGPDRPVGLGNPHPHPARSPEA